MYGAVSYTHLLLLCTILMNRIIIAYIMIFVIVLLTYKVCVTISYSALEAAVKKKGAYYGRIQRTKIYFSGTR